MSKLPRATAVLILAAGFFLVASLAVLLAGDRSWSPPPSGSISIDLDRGSWDHARFSATDGQATLARPLFWETRRPPDPRAEPVAEPEPEAPATTPLDEAVLLGIYHSEQGQGVLLKPDSSAAPQRIRLGERINGWVLDQVQPRSAVFLAPDQSTEFVLEHQQRID